MNFVWMIIFYAGTSVDHISFDTMEACEKGKASIISQTKEENSWNSVPRIYCVKGYN